MKLKELFEAPKDSSSSFISKIKRAMNPTGDGEQKLAAKTNALLQRWSDYRGQTNAVPNAANIEHWVKNTLGLDSPEIWGQAIDEYSEENPKAGQKYKDEENLNPNEISQFLSKLVQVRLMNPTVPLWTQRIKNTAGNNSPTKAPKDTTSPGSKKEKEQAVWDSNKGNPASTNINWTGGKYTGNKPTNIPNQMPAHPVTAKSEPTPTVTNTQAQVNNPGINPEPENMNKPAMLPNDDKNAVDWEKLRKRFPEKPRVKVSMDSRPAE